MEFDLVVNLESWAKDEVRPRGTLRLDAKVEARKLTGWKVDGHEEDSTTILPKGEDAKAALLRNFECRLPLSWLLATPGSSANSQTSGEFAGQPKQSAAAIAPTSRLKLRFSLWHDRMPVDALPVEGWIELHLVSEAELALGM